MTRFVAMLVLMTVALAHVTKAQSLVETVEKNHGRSAWVAQDALKADLKVTFGDALVIAGPIVFDTPVGRVNMQPSEGVSVIFDGQHAWVSPGESSFAMARFHALTWPYFAAMAFKLSDPGAQVTPMPATRFDERILRAAKLTFEADTGDAPDDWYILFQDEEGRLAGAAYIVTYGGVDADQAEKEVHAVRYEDFACVDGALLPTRMTLWNWSPTQGIHGQPLGEMILNNPQFTDVARDTFAKPDNAHEDKLPQ